MRLKKSKEINIFNASVVDLFASSTGVFLILSIYFLTNQGSNPVAAVEPKAPEKKKIEKIVEVKKASSIVDNILLVATKLKSLYSNSPPSVQRMMELGALNKGDKYKLEGVYFFPGLRKIIQPYGGWEIDRLVTYLKKNPTVRIEVRGHRHQSKRSYKKNGPSFSRKKISRQRSAQVCLEITNRGIPDSRLSCKGYGSLQLINLTNDSYSVEAQENRRVEIIII